MTNDRKKTAALDGPQFERRVAHDYFVRFHMSVILFAVISSGVLASKCLMIAGVSLRFRYPIAVLVSYLTFLLLVRVWIWYVSLRCAAAFQLSNLDLGGSYSSGGGGVPSQDFSGFGGGSSGGGGASSSWDADNTAAVVSQPVAAPSGSHWWPSLDLDIDDDWLVVVLLIALVTCILGGGVYLVYAAPHILPEAAWQVVLAGTLTKVSKEEHHNWMAGVLRSTWIPFVIVMVMAGALGWAVHHSHPEAIRLIDVFRHAPQ